MPRKKEEQNSCVNRQVSFAVPPQQDGWTLRDFLKAQGVSSAYIRRVKALNPGITLGGQHKNTDWRVHTGEEYQLPLVQEAEETAVPPQPLGCHIIYESDFAMAVEKPAGMAVHPTLGYADGTLANALAWEYQKRGEPFVFRPVNRLDVGTTGLVLLAKNSLAAPFLSQSVQKIYTAIITGELPQGKEGSITAPIGLCKDSIVKHGTAEDGKPSRTDYKVLASGGGLSLVECYLFTGRTHQIRVHFASLGHPLLGDGLYGQKSTEISRPALHCSHLCFCEPDRKNTRVCSPLPADMEEIQKYLEKVKNVKSTKNER